MRQFPLKFCCQNEGSWLVSLDCALWEVPTSRALPSSFHPFLVYQHLNSAHQDKCDCTYFSNNFLNTWRFKHLSNSLAVCVVEILLQSSFVEQLCNGY
ncbi:hypothetical protein QQP08_020307 [Theobroma cacao]|nr:hypothetical protein QQP08_020307 [Theobroma cacao]